MESEPGTDCKGRILPPMSAPARHALFAVFLASVLTQHLLAAAPSSQPATAMEAAKQFTDQFKLNATEAIEKYWDFDRIFVQMFGDDMKNVSDADRAEMRSQLSV